jgi:two-component system, chemotaxis family, sensor kinase Cph1
MNIRTPPDPDLSVCEREPIHIPGSIQPHGILLAVRVADRVVTYASANTAALFGLDPAAILGHPFDRALPDLAAEFEAEIGTTDPEGGARYLRALTLTTAGGERAFDAVLSRSGAHAVLELEEIPGNAVASLDTLYPILRRFRRRAEYHIDRR